MPRFTITVSDEEIVALYKRAARAGISFSDEAARIIAAAVRDEIPEPAGATVKTAAARAFVQEQPQEPVEEALVLLKSIHDMLADIVRATRPQMQACRATHPASGQRCIKPWGHIAVPGDAPHQFPPGARRSDS